MRRSEPSGYREEGKSKRLEEREVDVIVVGAGIAGLSSALHLLQFNQSVCLLEKRSIVGGLGNYAVGLVTAAPTSLQRKSNISDSVEAFYRDLKTFSEKNGFTDLNTGHFLREYAGKSGKCIEWLMELGIEFGGPIPEAKGQIPRRLIFLPSIRDAILKMRDRFLEMGGQLIYNFHVDSLIVSETAGIDGVIGRNNERITRRKKCKKGVILSTGAFSSNAILIKELIPSGDSGDSLVPDLSGDGIVMALEHFAATSNTDIFPIQLRFTGQSDENGYISSRNKRTGSSLPNTDFEYLKKFALYTSPSPSLFRLGGILVDRSGNRFSDETLDLRYVALLANHLPDKETFVLFDQRIATELDKWPNYISTFPGKGYGYLSDYRQFENEILYLAYDLRELASMIRAEPRVFETNIEKYNAMARSGKDLEFGRKTLSVLSTPPFYALGPVKPVLTTTVGGLKTDTNCRVLDGQGKTVPGLYAIGDGSAGAVQLLPGTHVGWALVSGMIAADYISKL